MNALVEQLRRSFPEYAPIVTHRGTTAIVLALDLERRRQGVGEAIVPSTVCPSVPLAITWSGMTPKFCDVDPETFLLSLDSVRAAVSPRTRAVVAVHLFGRQIDLAQLRKVVPPSVKIIEDAAQSAGSAFDPPAGDYVILSFSEKKVIPGRGGAVLCRSEQDENDLRALERVLPEPPPADVLGELASAFRDYTTGLHDLLRTQDLARGMPVFPAMAEHFRPLYVARYLPQAAQEEVTAEALRRAASLRAQRWQHYQAYAAHLSNEVGYVRFREGEMIWRLPVLLGSHRAQLLALTQVRRRGALISNHYFPVSWLYGDVSCQVARRIALGAINLWVDSKTNPALLPEICRDLNEIARSRDQTISLN
jgi:DegT/DnrJ/EryC1/StrS aminotransferase family